MAQGKFGLRPAEVLHGGVEGSVRHVASGCKCGGVNKDQVSEVAQMNLNLKRIISGKATECLYIYHVHCRWQDVVTFATMTTWHPGPWIFSPPEPAGACLEFGLYWRFQAFGSTEITNWTQLGDWRHSPGTA